MKWGMVGMEENETPRPEFISDRSVTKDLPHPVTGSLYYFYPPAEDRKRKCISFSVSGFFVMCVIAAVTGTFAARFQLMDLEQKGKVQGAGIVAALINAIQIQVMGGIYSFVSLKLNKYENHKTETQYEDAIITKTFVIQFINSFSSMFFIAFAQMFLADTFEIVPYCTGNRDAGGCMKVLQTTMGILFLTNLVSGTLTTVVVPYIQKRAKEFKEFQDAVVKDVSDIEREFMLVDYHPVNGSFSDYGVLVIQFAYATMFISAFPLASALAFVNNYVMQRLNAWKFCQMCRRPEPRSAEDIGSWLSILEIISYTAVLVSSGLVAFTGKFAVNQTWASRAWIFFGQSLGIILVKLGVSIYSPPMSREVEVQLERQQFIRDKIFDNVPDEVESVFSRNLDSNVTMDIRITDDDPL
jgi:anoctamin-10/anoctamin-7